jgi:cellobionic acid phosphorylase
VYIPNYYRGAYYQYPHTAGRSSQLFNTGTVSWVYRCVVEGLFGLQGDPQGLFINPQLPSSWDCAKATRQFRGATFHLIIKRDATDRVVLICNGVRLADNYVRDIQPGYEYQLEVLIPFAG